MTALAAAQQRMHAALIRPDADPAAAQALFAGDGRLGAAAGLAVYQRGYLVRIAACMRAQFPALCHALGRALFDDFVADYVRNCPPMRHTLHDLGRRFPGWLEANRPDDRAGEADAARETREAPLSWIDFMIDLARFEQALFAMLDAEGNEGQAFATPATPDAALRLQPAFALGDHAFPVAAYYHAVRGGEAPPMPPPCPSPVALVRTDYVTRTIALTATHHAFLAAMQAGADVAAALAMVSARFGLDPAEIARSWHDPQGSRARWIALGLFVPAGE